MVDGAPLAVAQVEVGAALFDAGQVNDLPEQDQPMVVVLGDQVVVQATADQGQEEWPAVKDDKQGVWG